MGGAEMAKKAWRTTGMKKPRWGITALALGYVLGRSGLAEAQDGRITVLSPTRDDEIHAGDLITVSFNTTGEGVDGPYDLDLYKGAFQVSAWCSESEGCDIEDGSIRVIISSSNEIGPGYFVMVTDRNSSISGESQVFELLEELPTNSSDVARTPEYDEEIASGGFVGDISVALVVVASICGLALVCALIAACIMVSRRNAAANLEVKESTPDFELGGPIDRATPGRFDSQSSGTRGFSGGNPIARKRSFSVGGSVKSLGVGAASPARSMARGDQQRGRSQSRDSTGPRMYSSNTPRRTRGSSTSPGRELGSYDDGGGAMVVVTPGRSHSVRSGGSRTPRRLMSGGDSGRGRQMYDRSSVPSWDESGGRMMGTSRSPGRGLAGGRSDSTGRLRRPSRYTGQGADLGDGKRMTMTPGRRRSNRAGRVGSPHVLGIRRSKSAGHSLSREDDEGNAASVGEEGRWADRGMTAAVGKVERGRRSQRSLSKSARSKSMHDTSDDHKTPRSSGSVDSYGREKRSRSKPNTPSRRSYNRSGTGERDDPSTNSDVSWEELRSTYLKSTTPSRRSYPLPSYGDAVHHADEGDSIDGRDPQPYGPRDAESSSDHLSIGIPNDPSPSSYKSLGRRSRSSHLARSNGLASSKKSAASYSKSPGDRFSPGTRAVSARKAARDAQLSAERALAAAAMASRAADLAAQAALEAEADADADLIDDDLDSFEEVEMSPPSKASSGEVGGSLVREKMKVFSGGSTLGSSLASFEKSSTAGKSPFSRGRSGPWAQAGEKEDPTKAEQSSADPKEALASMVTSNGDGGGSSSSGRPNNSWVRNGGGGGADTAGGSINGTGHTENGGTVSAPTPARHKDPKDLAMRRRAFVKQYSGASDLAEDSDYSLHDHAAAAAIAAAVGRPSNGHSRVNSATIMSWDKSSSLDGREDSARAGDLGGREGDVDDGKGQGLSKRVRPESLEQGMTRPSAVAGPSH